MQPWAGLAPEVVQEPVPASGQERVVRTLVPKLVLASGQERVLGPVQPWAGPAPALAQPPVWAPRQARLLRWALQTISMAQPPELASVHWPLLVLVQPSVPLVQEWALASAEGLELAWVEEAVQPWAGPASALGHPVWVPPQAHFPASAPQRTLMAQKRVLLPQELVPQVRDPLPQVHHPVPVLGQEWVLVLSTERELGLASAEGLGLAWE